MILSIDIFLGNNEGILNKYWSEYNIIFFLKNGTRIWRMKRMKIDTIYTDC